MASPAVFFSNSVLFVFYGWKFLLSTLFLLFQFITGSVLAVVVGDVCR